MPSDDAQRTWFPGIVARLRSNWHEGMSMPDFITLETSLMKCFEALRASRNIRTPIITCACVG